MRKLKSKFGNVTNAGSSVVSFPFSGLLLRSTNIKIDTDGTPLFS
jgi:hypothetical protein